MNNPQLKNGYTSIANELIEIFIQTELSGQEFRLMLFILRKTYGYHKKEDYISLTQMAKALRISMMRASQVINSLQKKKIITLKENIEGKTKKYQFNKSYEQWIPYRKTDSYKKNDTTLKVLRKKPYRKTDSTKETLTKETTTKEKTSLQEVIDSYFSLKDYPEKWCKQNYPRHCKPAKRLLALTDNNSDEVMMMVKKAKKYFGDKGLSWKLETVEKNWNEIKTSRGRKKYG